MQERGNQVEKNMVVEMEGVIGHVVVRPSCPCLKVHRA